MAHLRERFSEEIDPFNAQFISSVGEDERLVPFDIHGSIAHARMLGRQGIISRKDSTAIVHGLKQILKEWRQGKFRLDQAYEDVHMNVERRLTQLTPAGAKLHTARSRNDQVALDMRLWAVNECRTISGDIKKLQAALIARAMEHEHVIMPGMTHMQHAQPIHFSHVFLAWHDALERDRRRFEDCLKRLAVSPLGAGALAGTSLRINPAMVARDIGFAKTFTNSLDAVGDRDFCAEFASDCALLMLHLSQMAEMLVLWSTPEFGYVELPDNLSTSSSLMPQKKNPDMIELVRGQAGQAFASVVEILTTLKAMPIGYNRDLQATQRPTFAAADVSRTCLKVLTMAFKKLSINETRLEKASQDSQILATDLAEYLVERGVAFREAHSAVGRLMRHCATRGLDLKEMTPPELKNFHPIFGKVALARLDPHTSVWRRNSPGGTGTRQVKKRLAGLKSSKR